MEKCRAPIVPPYVGINLFGQVHEELTEDRVPEVGFWEVEISQSGRSNRLVVEVLSIRNHRGEELPKRRRVMNYCRESEQLVAPISRSSVNPSGVDGRIY